MQAEKSNMIFIASKLKDEGVRFIVMEFSGCGDSGDVNEYVAYAPSLLPEDTEFEDLSIPMSWDDDDEKHLVEYQIDRETENALWNFAHIPAQEYDWWNNDGGEGRLLLDLETFEYKTDFQIAYISHEQYSNSGKLEV